MSQQPEAAGTFRQHPLPKLLFYLYRKQFTGMMAIRHPGGESRVFLRDGMPVYAEVPETVEPIGRILLEQGIIDENVYNLSLAQAAKTGQRQGDILQSSGAITEDQVTQAIKLQLSRKLLRLFKTREAQFALYRDDHPHGRVPEEAAKMRIHPRRLIYHGIRNAYDMPRLREEVGDMLQGQHVRLDARKEPNLDRYQFGQDDEPVLDLLRSRFWDLSALQQASGTGELAIWMLVYALLVTDVVELVPAGEHPAVTPMGLAHAQIEHRPVATPVPFQPPPGSRMGATRGVGRSSIPPAPKPGFSTGSQPAMRSPTNPPAERQPRHGSNPPIYEPRSGSLPPRSGSLPPRPGSQPPIRPGTQPPRPGSQPPIRPGTLPPRVGSLPPRSGSLPPRTGSKPPRPGSQPPRVVMTQAEIRALTPDALSLKQQIDEKLKYLERRNHFEILGVDRAASKEVIKAAYIQNAKTFHPDRLAQFRLEPLRADVEKIFARVSEAQSVLLDDRRRKEYTDTLDGAARGDAEKARKLLQAELYFREAEMAMRHKSFAEAEEKFKQSVELNPEEGEHHAMLAWCMYQNPSHSRAGILEHVKAGLGRAIKLGRNNPRPYYLLGELFLAENDLDKAMAYFRKALELREDHVEAERGLRLATMRKEKDSKKGGWFRKK